MKNILIKSILLTSMISYTNAQSQYSPQQHIYEDFQAPTSSRKLRLNEIKAKLNRLKSRSSNSSQNNQFTKQDFSNNRSARFQTEHSPSFQKNNTRKQDLNMRQQYSSRDNNRSQNLHSLTKEPQNMQRSMSNNLPSNHRDSRRAFSKRGSSKQGSFNTALVRSCENAGKDLTLRGKQGEKARHFYTNRCDRLISKISIEHKLDNLLDLQGKYLSLQGRHQEANRFITLAYQQAPNALNTNIALIKNLVSLGQASMAEDMLLFYIGEKGVQNLDPREHQSLKTLHQQLKRMQ
ncbi:MAG: hypothetical protein KC646_11415 [Candidatus Cloacimonetes bacterium]|nr:hypothetical protein [Candidatus Cloacimonadota bacterium]